MIGRRPTSKKWTSFPQEYIDQIRSVFQDSFAQSLGNSVLVVEGRIYAEEICLRVGFREPSALRQNNFEISVDFEPTKQNAIEKIYTCIDAAAMLMNSFFDGAPQTEFPTQWKALDFEKKPLYFQFSTINTDLESQANQLLGEVDDSLVREGGEDPETNTSTKSNLLH